jgi:FKBP-type peptidyl-prolyl cis-trans isomerase (trigger factor)
MPPSPEPLLVSTKGSQHVFQLNVLSAEVDRAAEARLAAIAKSVRLPGFRPGKIPAEVLRRRYGAQARKDAVNQLSLDTTGTALPPGSIVSALEVASGMESGDLVIQVTATYLPDLPDFDAAQLEIERLTASDADLQAAGVPADVLQQDVRQQVLDRLHEAYSFPVHPALTEREFQTIWKEAVAQGASESLAPEFRAIAERRVRLGAVVAEMARRHNIRKTPIEEHVIEHFLAQVRITERRAEVEELKEMAEE